MTGYDMTKVHQANLKILKEIDRICRKYRIKYLIDAGTLLGAVRHQGFIPWDDDADLAFTRENYEAFLKVVRRELPDSMELLMPQQLQGGRVFYDFTARIVYKHSKLHEDSELTRFYEGKLNHIFVDLFVIDRLPRNKKLWGMTRLWQKVVYGLAMGHRYQLDYHKYPLPERIMVAGLATVGKMVPMKSISWMQHKLSVKNRRSAGRWCYYSNYQPDFLYVTIERQWCEETVDLPFEDMLLMAPDGWHQVLTEIYGDYMKLPPVSQRCPSHSSMEIEIYDEVVG